MRRTTRLRELLSRPEIVVAPGAFDCISASLIEHMGFDAIYMSGGNSGASVGFVNVGVRSLSEHVWQTARICDVTTIPVIADGEAGYGSPVTVMRLVREMEKAGAAGLHLEDQELPNRCGHFAGKRLVSMETHVAQIAAAAEARTDPDFLIIVRVDAIAVTGFEDALERARAYVKAGADMVFMEGIETTEQLKRIPQELDVPLLVNMVEGGKTPFLTAKEMEQLGYDLAIYPSSLYSTAIKQMQETLKVLRDTGTTEGVGDHMYTLAEVNDLDLLGDKAVFAAIDKFSTGGRVAAQGTPWSR